MLRVTYLLSSSSFFILLLTSVFHILISFPPACRVAGPRGRFPFVVLQGLTVCHLKRRLAAATTTDGVAPEVIVPRVKCPAPHGACSRSATPRHSHAPLRPSPPRLAATPPRQPKVSGAETTTEATSPCRRSPSVPRRERLQYCGHSMQEGVPGHPCIRGPPPPAVSGRPHTQECSLPKPNPHP